MLIIEADSYQIQPNCALSAKALFIIYSAIFSVSLTIALFFIYLGAWIVLPFAGLEMLALGLAFYYLSRCSKHWEVLNLEEHQLVCSYWVGKGLSQQQFPRCWAKLLFTPAKGLHPSRLSISYQGQWFEIARWLTDEEKQFLADKLRQYFQCQL